MANSGTYPIDPATDVGKLRFLVGDTVASNIDEVAHTADYAYWGDSDLQTFLTLSGDNIYLAGATAYTQLAAQLTLSGGGNRTVRTEDLGLGGTGPAGDIRLIAREWRYTAEQAQASAAEDYFDLVDGPSIFPYC